MNKAKRIIACVLVVAMATVSLAGCTTFDNFRKAFLNKNAENDAQIKIGVFEPMSGGDKEAGEAEIMGIELANKLYPEAGGSRVELIYADNKSDMDVADTAMADLMKDKPTAVLGSYGNIYSLIAGTHLQKAKIPGIAITNTNPLVTKNNPYYFRVSFVETYQAIAMARYVYEYLQQTTAAILIPDNNEQAVAMATNFKDKMEAQTANPNAIVTYQKYEAGAKDFTTQLLAIKATGVKSVYLCGDEGDISTILKQAKELGLTDITFLGDSTWTTDEFIKEISKYVDGNIAFTTLFTDEEMVTETSKQFLEAYAEEYGEGTPAPETALGFDAYLLLIQTINRIGADCTGEELMKALMETENFQGASGTITFDSYGDPEKSVVINTLKGKHITPLYTIDPNAVAVPPAPAADDAAAADAAEAPADGE